MEPQPPAEPRTTTAPEAERRLYHAPGLRDLGTLNDITRANPTSGGQDASYNPGSS
jgi:hypothetical protein